MADKPHITREGYVAQLVRVGVWATPQNPIQYAFLEQKPAYLPNEPGWTSFSGAQRAAAQHAFAMIAEVVDLTFVQVADNQQQPGPDNPRINFYANSINLNFSGSMDAYQLDGSSAIHGADIRLNSARIAQRQSNEGFQDFTSLVALHEILHAMGLSHPGDYNGQGPTYQNDAEFVEDTVQFSVMSYFAAANTGADHFIGDVLYAGRTPLLYDVLALQSLYSPNMTTRTGDTVYGFNSNTGANSPFDFAVTTGPVVAIWDAGGTDTIDLSGYGEASLIDLNEGAFSDAGGLTRNIAIAFNVIIENAVGGAGADRLIGNAVANRLDGGAGADLMEGGPGDDVYVVDDGADITLEAAGAGNDLVLSPVSRILGAHLEKLTLTGAAAVDGTGNALANIITGNGAANRLDGGAGADAMAGGLGDDVYVVDQAGDTVAEAAGGGTDTVSSAVNWILGANLENLTLTGAAAYATGNGLANQLTGNGLANTLNGGLGADTMAGGLGDDTYVVDHALDRAVENSGAGNDLVNSSVSFTLGAHVERLTLTGGAAIDGVGNALANGLTGNAAANRLDGGAGADAMAGGAGNDVYVVDQSGDTVTEAAGGGTDTVQSAVNFILGANVEDLILTGTVALYATGNALANRLTGNALANVLNGGAGADTMAGGLGNDDYVIDNIGDRITEAAGGGVDTARSSVTHALGAHVENLVLTGGAAVNGTGNGLANMLTGNAAANRLEGGLGADRLTGGGGADTFVYRSLADSTPAAAGRDTIADFNGDKIDLSAIDAVAGTAANEAFDFIGTAAFSHTAGELRMYQAGPGWYVAGDVDGDALADFLIGVTPSPALTAADFAL